MLAKESVVQFALEDPLRSCVLLRGVQSRLQGLFFDLRELGLVFANFWSVCFAGVRNCPSFATRSAEACRFLAPLQAISPEFLIERHKETTSGPWLRMLALVLVSPGMLFPFSLSDAIHLCLEVWFLLFSQQQAEVVIVLVVLL